ncbi:MAG: alpha/beta hydrolase [Anaerolineaceae bacterium]|nr:MAG: alpha/beta hydrolase [Anaerolineaceae bacterium]
MVFPNLNETEELTDSIRAKADGAFIRLSDGICHYELRSPPQMYTFGEGPGVGSVILVHGFSVPYFIWDPTFDFLAKSGYRVLRFDLFGRGLSDRPRVRYDIHLFVRQLKDLLDALEISEPVHLAGLSMGGPVSAAFVNQYPDRVKSHILIDPAGTKTIELSPILRLAKLPILPDIVFGLAGDGSLLKGIASDFYDPALVEQFIGQYKPQMRIKGFKSAILSTIRNGMLDSFYETYQRVGQLQKPTLLLWGRNDTTVPFAHSEILRAVIPHAQFHVIENCGHIPHYEKPEEVNPILQQFLTSNL